nr:uncharacterized protein LOC131786065 [Pocillopora verrucosa]
MNLLFLSGPSNSPSQDYTHPDDQTTLLQTILPTNSVLFDKGSYSRDCNEPIRRISDHISVSDSYTVLLDECLKENQSLREQMRQHDEENASKFEELSNKVDSV